MNKKYIQYISILSGLALLAIGGVIFWEYLLARRVSKKLDAGSSPSLPSYPSPTLPTSGSGKVYSNLSCHKTLRKGVKGKEVERLQEYLNTMLRPPLILLVVDGDFGPKTEEALYTITGLSETSLFSINLPLGEHDRICQQ